MDREKLMIEIITGMDFGMLWVFEEGINSLKQ